MTESKLSPSAPPKKRSLLTTPRLIAVLLCVMVFALLLTTVADMTFLDEVDVFGGGESILRGLDIYQVKVSQHMPFSYYLDALLALFFQGGYYAHRIAFYVFLSLLWGAAYLHHREHFEPIALFLMPFIYIMSLRFIDLGNTMISDHWQGVGHALLLLEMLRYLKTREITASSAVWISLCIVLSFGTAFVSAFTILLVCVGVAAFQVWITLQEKDAGKRKALLTNIRRQDVRLVLICLAPFAALMAWYAVSGNLLNFYQQAYLLNREIYPAYMGGFGSSASGAVLGCFVSYGHMLINALRSLVSTPVHGIVFLVENVCIILVSLRMARKNAIMGVFFFLAAIFSGVRDFTGFHSMPYQAVAAMCTALCLGSLLRVALTKRSAVLAVLACLFLALTASASVQHLPRPSTVARLLRVDSSSYIRRLVDTLIDEGECIHTTSVLHDYSFRLNRPIDFSGASSTPWTYEAVGDRELASLEANQPKLLFYSENYSLWGYARSDYAPEFEAYVREHYTKYENELYIRNEYLPEAYRRLEAAGYPIFPPNYAANEVSPSFPSDMLPRGAAFSQFFTAQDTDIVKVEAAFGTYYGQQQVGVTVQLFSGDGQELLAEHHVDAIDVNNNDHTSFPITAKVTPQTLYELRFTLDGSAEDGRSFIAFFHSEPGTATDDSYAVVDGQRADYAIASRVYYKSDE